MIKSGFRKIPGLMLIMIFLLAVSTGFAAEPGPAAPQNVPQNVPELVPEPPVDALTIAIDRNELENGGVIKVTGTAPAGRPVFLEVWANEQVRVSRFDNRRDPETGVIPYIFYITHEMPAFYKIFIPREMQPKIDKELQEARWSFSRIIRETGAGVAYQAPAKIAIDRYQATLFASVVGSRGELLTPMDARATRSESMRLIRTRFRDLDRVMSADVVIDQAGNFSAEINIRSGLAPGQYNIVAVVDEKLRSEPLTFINNISFPVVYMGNAGTSINLLWPFILTLAVTTFGVLMGAGGGFILNPLLLILFPLPHTVVAGTVMPTVLFSQGSGIYNYSKIKFINWKLGIGIGIAMLAGGFIGPKLTEMITLDQFKWAFGIILLILAALMLWQTTRGYLEGNKKEMAILNEFKRRAEESAKREAEKSAKRDEKGA